MAKLLKIVSVAFVLALPLNTLALEFGGEVKLQQIYGYVGDNSVLAATTNEYHLTQSNIRLLADHQVSNWSFDVDYLFSADYSDQLNSLNTTETLQTNSALFFDLEKNIHQSNSSTVEHRLDRASVKYSGASWIFQLGRQAHTWGNGVVFHPMDLLNPFSPNAKDTIYKSGVDAFYSQYLFDSGADVQFLWVPRNDPLNNDHDSKLDSSALKYLFYAHELQVDLLVAQDYEQNVIGLGVVGPVGDAIWKLDIVSNETTSKDAISVDFNVQYSWQWGEHPVSGYLEYYRNGFAESDSQSLQDFSQALNIRLQRGQVFSASKHNLSIGGQIQWSPLVIISTNLLHEFDGSSQLLLTNLIYNASESSNLVIGVQIANGKKGSQYGGYFVDESKQLTTQPANQLYVRYEWFF